MCADTVEEMEEWMSYLLASTVTLNWGSVLGTPDPAKRESIPSFVYIFCALMLYS